MPFCFIITTEPLMQVRRDFNKDIGKRQFGNLWEKNKFGGDLHIKYFNLSIADFT